VVQQQLERLVVVVIEYPQPNQCRMVGCGVGVLGDGGRSKEARKQQRSRAIMIIPSRVTNHGRGRVHVCGCGYWMPYGVRGPPQVRRILSSEPSEPVESIDWRRSTKSVCCVFRRLAGAGVYQKAATLLSSTTPQNGQRLHCTALAVRLLAWQLLQ
jgi:hypothetical protein